MWFHEKLGREEDGFWKDTVPEPHHTDHTMGEAYKVHLCNSTLFIVVSRGARRETHPNFTCYTKLILILATFSTGCLNSFDIFKCKEDGRTTQTFLHANGVGFR